MVEEKPDSPKRIVRLQDGTSTNPTGGVLYVGQGSKHLQSSTRYKVADVRVGVDTGKVFIGILVNDLVRRYTIENFVEGTTNDN